MLAMRITIATVDRTQEPECVIVPLSERNERGQCLASFGQLKQYRGDSTHWAKNDLLCIIVVSICVVVKLLRPRCEIEIGSFRGC